MSLTWSWSFHPLTDNVHLCAPNFPAVQTARYTHHKEWYNSESRNTLSSSMLQKPEINNGAISFFSVNCMDCTLVIFDRV